MGLRWQALHEISKLRQQLTAIANLLRPHLDLDPNARLPPPTRQQERLLSQVLVAAFADQIAMRKPNAPGTSSSSHILSGRA